MHYYDSTKSTKIIGATNINEVLEISNAKWNVYPTEIMTGNGIELPEHKALVRDDNNTPLGIVGKGYEIISNTEAFSFFDTLVQENQAEYKSYQEFDGGKKVVIKARIDHQDNVRVGDKIENEISLINSFDGSSSFKVMFSVLRLACTNGMVSKEKLNSVSIRHTKNKDKRIHTAMQILGMAGTSYNKFLAQCKQMDQTRIDEKMVETFVNSLVGIDLEAEKEASTRKKNIAETITELVYTGKGNKGESVWDLYNGATEYYDHYASKKSENLEKSSLFGDGFNKKDKALNLAMALL